MKLLGAFVIFGLITALITHVYIVPTLGLSLATHWALVFFVVSVLIVYLLRHAFERDLAPINFLNRNYYRSSSILLAIFILFPALIFLLKILFYDTGDVSAKQNVAAVFIGRVYGIENGSFTMVKFDIIKKISGDDEGFSIVETGLIMPKDCFFTIKTGDIFKVYLQKNIISGYALTCNGMQRLEETNEMER